MHRLWTFASAAAVLAGAAMITGSAAANPTNPQSQTGNTVRDQVRQLLESTPGQIVSPMARVALENFALGGDPHDPQSARESAHRTPHGLVGSDPIQSQAVTTDGPAPATAGLPNVRVNDPAEDSHFVDQTTQSETALAVAGSDLVVGFNDSQQSLVSFTGADLNLSGVAASHDGGQTFTDGGVLPNAPGYLNLGDPWLTSSGGAFYYSTLMSDYRGAFNISVGVSRSTDGGRSWGEPVNASLGLEQANLFQLSLGDKPAMVSTTSGLYVAWDDFTLHRSLYGYVWFNGLAVAHSTDGGKTWTASYASNRSLFDNGAGYGCGRTLIGAQPVVSPDGTVYVAAEQVGFCGRNGKTHDTMAVFASNDGGATWTQPGELPITSVTQGFGQFFLGPGRYMRSMEFPTLTAFRRNLYMAWNDAGDGSGHSHIEVATSGNGGHSWTTSYITSGNNDEVQPSVTVDGSGVHILYYELSGARPACAFSLGCGGTVGSAQLDVLVSNSSDGSSWTARRVTTTSFPGVITLPQFDTAIAWTYMGDYIASVTDGVHQYFAWGDNRDIVTNWVWPQGRHDPDVFFARQ